MTTAGIECLALSNPFVTGSRRAPVVTSDEAYGLARMFEMMRKKGGEEVRAFRLMEDALEWLGIEAPPE